MGRPAASKWRSGNGYTLHGSVYGGCIHAQVLALMGEEARETPPYMQNLFDAGHESEAKTKDWLRSLGIRVKDKPDEPRQRPDGELNKFDDQIELKTFYKARDGSSILLALHLDGVWSGNGSGLRWVTSDTLESGVSLWEHKALSPEKFDKFVAGGVCAVSQRYAWQVSAAMVLGRMELEKKGKPNPALPLVFSVERRDYDSATRQYSLSGERVFQLLREPIYSAAEVEARCQSIIHHFLDGVVPECDSEYKCDYTKDEERTPAYPESSEDAAEFHELATQYQKHTAEASYHESRALAARAGLTRLAAPLGGLVKVGGYTVNAFNDKRGRAYFKFSVED